MHALLLALVAAPAGSLALSPTPTPLARALDAVDEEHIRADLRFVSADELEGRDTPSEGLRLAALYLRARLERLGLEPAGDHGYFDRYELVRTRLDLERTAVHLTRGEEERDRELVFGEDYFVAPEGFRDLSLAGQVVFVGEAGADDVEELDLAGRWALAVDARGRSSRERDERLRRAGALGLILLQPDGDYARSNRLVKWMKRRARRGTLGVPVERLPAIHLTGEGAEELGLDPDALAPGDLAPFELRDRRAVLGEPERFEVENVAGLWPGADPELAREVIVLSAHYDHVGVDGDDVYNGADDNGSGICTLLAVAEGLETYGPMRRSVLFLWVSGEEKGLKGSYAWTSDPTLPEGHRAVCNLNVDMVGRNASDELLVTPSAEHPEYNTLVRMAERHARREGFPELGGCDEYWRRSDHMNFSENLEIPVAFLFAGVHEDYHRPTDTFEKVDCDKIERVSRLVLRVLDGLQTDTLDL